MLGSILAPLLPSAQAPPEPPAQPEGRPTEAYLFKQMQAARASHQALLSASKQSQQKLDSLRLAFSAAEEAHKEAEDRLTEAEAVLRTAWEAHSAHTKMAPDVEIGAAAAPSTPPLPKTAPEHLSADKQAHWEKLVADLQALRDEAVANAPTQPGKGFRPDGEEDDEAPEAKRARQGGDAQH